MIGLVLIVLTVGVLANAIAAIYNTRSINALRRKP